MSFFKKLKDRMFKSSSKLDEGLDAIIEEGAVEADTPDPEAFGKLDFRRPNPRFQEPAYSQNRAAMAVFEKLCERLGKSPVEVAIAWVLSAGEHVITIPGTRTAEHLEVNVAAADFRLTQNQRAEIAAAFPDGFPWGDRFSSAQAIGIEPTV